MNHPENFKKYPNSTAVLNNMLKDTNISFKAKGLLTYLLSCEDTWNFNIKSIAAMSTDKYESVRTGLKELETNGYLKRTVIRKDGKIFDTVYEISDERIFTP